MQATTETLPIQSRKRLDLVDVARGFALGAMVIFHGAWDLSNADLISVDISNHAGWQWFARSIAASFLTITGLSLVLAHGSGAGFNSQRFMRRWLMLAGAALLVSAGTWFMFPEGFVFFGILHHIALASVLALPFLGLPPMLTCLAGILVFALPAFVKSAMFDPIWLIWTGLAVRVPDAVDFVPLFPWFGFVLVGIALGRLLQPWLAKQSWQARHLPTRVMALAGRHSLIFYLVHQPVLLGAIWLWLQIMSLPFAMDAMQRFEGDCRTACSAQGAPAEFCSKACACTTKAVAKEPGIEAAIRSGKLNARDELKLAELSKLCSRVDQATPN